MSGAANGSVENLYVSDFDAKISGAGSFVLSGAADKATIHISGAGDMTIAVVDVLEAKISGIGSIEYFGSPTVTQSVSGLGTVSQKSTELPSA